MASDIKVEQGAQYQNDDKVGLNAESDMRKYIAIAHATDREENSCCVVKTEPKPECDGTLSVHVKEVDQQNEYNKECTNEIKMEPQVELEENTMDESVFEIENDVFSKVYAFAEINRETQVQCTDMKKYGYIVHAKDREENSRCVVKTEPEPECNSSLSVHEADQQHDYNKDCTIEIKMEPKVQLDENKIHESVIEIENDVFSEFCGFTEIKTEPQFQCTESNLNRYFLDGGQNTDSNRNSRDVVKINGSEDHCENDYRLDSNENSVISDTGHTPAHCVPRRDIETVEDAQNFQNINTVYKRYLSCGRCGNKYRFARHLQAHKKKCKGSSNICFVCGKLCSSLADFYSHISVHSQEENLNSKEGHNHKPNKIEMGTERLQTIEKIDNSTSSFSRVSHVSSTKIGKKSNHYQRKQIAKDSVVHRKHFSCTKCRKMYRFVGHLLAHEKRNCRPKSQNFKDSAVHRKYFSCTKCRKTYRFVGHLLAHEKRNCRPKSQNFKDSVVHKKQFSCTKCRKTYRFVGHLLAHKKRNCRPKSQNFSNNSQVWNLLRHKKQNLECKALPCFCSLCGRVFDTLTALSKHFHVHSDEETHVCAVCRIGFSSLINLKRHQELHNTKKMYKRCEQKQTVTTRIGPDSMTHRKGLANQNEDRYDIEKTNKEGGVNTILSAQAQEDGSQQNYFCFDCKVHFNYHDNIRKHKLHDHFKDVNLQFKSRTPQKRVRMLNDASNGGLDGTITNKFVAKKIHYVSVIHNKHFSGIQHTPELRLPNQRKDKPDMENTNRKVDVNETINPESQDVSQQNYFCFDCKVHFNYHDNIRKHKLHLHFKDLNLQFKSKSPQMRVSILNDASNENIDDTSCNNLVKKKENINKDAAVNKMLNSTSQEDVDQQDYFCIDCKVHFNYHDDIRKHKLHHHFKDVNLQFKSKTPQMRVSILNDASNVNINDTSCNNSMAVKKMENTKKEAAVNKMFNPISQGDVDQQDYFCIDCKVHFNHTDDLRKHKLSHHCKDVYLQSTSKIQNLSLAHNASNNVSLKGQKKYIRTYYDEGQRFDVYSAEAIQEKITREMQPEHTEAIQKNEARNPQQGHVGNGIDKNDAQNTSSNRHVDKKCLPRLNWVSLTCNICGDMLPTPTHLRKHVSEHLGIQEYRCSICDQTFTTKRFLQLHMEHHVKTMKLLMDRFLCNICLERFPSQEALTKHMFSHAIDIKGNKIEHKDLYICSICSKSLGSREALDNHVLLHAGEKHYICGVCQKQFAFEENLQRHMLLHSKHNPNHQSNMPMK